MADLDHMGRALLWSILIYHHPRPVRMTTLDPIFGSERKVQQLLTTLDPRVYADGGLCGLTDDEASRLQRRWGDAIGISGAGSLFTGKLVIEDVSQIVHHINA